MRKRVYITGGSSGIGLGLAHFYANRGDDIVLLARDQEKLDAAVSSCKSMSMDSSQVVKGESLDITAYHSLPAAMEKLAAIKIARGIRRHKAVIIPGVRASMMAWTARHFPELFARSSELLLRWKFS